MRFWEVIILNTKIALFIVLIVLVIGISTVQAEKTVKVNGCVGKSVSEFIHYLHTDPVLNHPDTIAQIGKLNFGTGVSLLARDEVDYTKINENFKEQPRNLGQAINILQSGAITGPVEIVIGPITIDIQEYNHCKIPE